MSFIIIFVHLKMSRVIGYYIPCFIRTHPNPPRDASQYTIETLVAFGWVIIGAEVSLSFKIWKLISHDSDHSNFTLLWVKVEAMDSKPSKNFL